MIEINEDNLCNCIYCGKPAKRIRKSEHILPVAIGGALTIPDVSEQQIDDQIFEQQKGFVRDMGLDKWLEMIERWSDESDDKGGWENLRSRVVSWAREKSVE